jgi:hypothetical protein
MGNGLGKPVTAKIEGGAAGIIIDARGRPRILPEDGEEMKRSLLRWLKALNAYPAALINRCEED